MQASVLAPSFTPAGMRTFSPLCRGLNYTHAVTSIRSAATVLGSGMGSPRARSTSRWVKTASRMYRSAPSRVSPNVKQPGRSVRTHPTHRPLRAHRSPNIVSLLFFNSRRLHDTAQQPRRDIAAASVNRNGNEVALALLREMVMAIADTHKLPPVHLPQFDHLPCFQVCRSQVLIRSAPQPPCCRSSSWVAERAILSINGWRLHQQRALLCRRPWAGSR